MADSSSSENITVALSMAGAVNRARDQFDRELQRGSVPSIEAYLALVDVASREELLRNLVAVEYEFARRSCSSSFALYFKRFPESYEVLRTLQNQLSAPDANAQNTPSFDETINECVVVSNMPHLRHFKLLEVAGSGGFSTVWRAKDLRLDREVAVKIPRADKAGRIDIAALRREAQVVAKLRHPNIISVHEVGEENGTSFIVTEYVEGVNLREWIKKHSINPSEGARLIAKLAMAVQHAHDHGVIHRDLKLANVLMDTQGEPHVADFGLAKREAQDDSLAVNGEILGTPACMAPEQARADHDSTDRRTDIYALGVMLYELITGKMPFRGDVPQLLQQIRENPPVLPRSLKSEIPKDLEVICMKCLAKNNSDRYATAQALGDDLFLFLNGETLRGVPVALPNRVWKWTTRNRRFVSSMIAIAILVASLSIGVMGLHHIRSQPTIPLSPVSFTTKPPGCRITVVAIDPTTGEPDPNKIQSAPGRTPLSMPLAGGDYLVVAVLDDQRFHEVIRHVPEPDEAVPFGYNHLHWIKRPSGIIDVHPITIPRPDVTVGMGFSEGIDQLVEPHRDAVHPTCQWRIPAFYVDVDKVSIAELAEKSMRKPSPNGFERILEHAGEGPTALMNHYNGVEYLEEIGKRLPTAAELYYLSSTVSPKSISAGTSDAPFAASSNCEIEGLHSGASEWTSTKPGGPFSGCLSIPKSLELESLTQMVRSGNYKPGTGLTVTGFKAKPIRKREAGVRGVRSVGPRLTPRDFMTTAEGTR